MKRAEPTLESAMRRNKDQSVAHFLMQLGRAYRHLQQEHIRATPQGKSRNSMAKKMRVLSERFERVSRHWVDDEAVRAAWSRHFYEGSPPPRVLEKVRPLTFKGVTELGTEVEVRRSDDGAYDIVVDGVLESHESVPWYLDRDMVGPIRVGGYVCTEVFDIPPAALAALKAFRTSPDADPPWVWAPALYEEGLIDEELALTSRGYRALGAGTPEARSAGDGVTFGVLVANGARARLFVLSATDGPEVPTLDRLVEVFHTTRPELRARESEVLSDTRPGLRREGGHGPVHGVSDRREGRRDTEDKRFASEVVEELLRVWNTRKLHRVVVVASPGTLGVLRPVLARSMHASRVESVREFSRDLTHLSPPALHDALAAAGFLPPRGRASAVQRPRGHAL